MASDLASPGGAVAPNDGTAGPVTSIGGSARDADVEPIPPQATVERPPEPGAGNILKEVGKQAIDQPGHFLVGAGPIWASRYLVGVPWYGWAAAPLLAYREWTQWPSKRWWDPPLDWAFLALGAVAATWGRRSERDLMKVLAAIHRRVARRRPVRGRVRARSARIAGVSAGPAAESRR